ISPILLLESCGEQVKLEKLSKSNKDRIAGLFDRLHKANFFQGSVGPRNVIVQPGPLTRRPAGRSLDSPSFLLSALG
ncbi:hypothetical protein EI94DRAFT_1433881, partial [Lactarius quietus]